LIASAAPDRTSAFDLATTSGSILNIGTDLSAVDEDEMGGAEHCSPSGNS
jgi:predicted fused transcriptional regulator/phosphomethylpyrimidine kinase